VPDLEDDMFGPLFHVDRTFPEMDALSRRLDALLGARGLDGRHGLLTHRSVSANPTLTRDDAGWTLSVDLPGASREDVSLTVHEGVLELEAHRTPVVPEGFEVRHRERPQTHLKRAWRLPDEVDADHVEASFEAGVLTVHLPKRPEAGPRRIELS
jgi:HSP20 family protein